MTDLSNKQTLKAVRQAMETALKTVEAEFGINFDLGSVRYEGDGSGFKSRITCSRVDDSGTAETPMAKSYRRHAESFGLDPAWLGIDLVNDAGDRVQIVGLKPRSPKFPLIYVNQRNGRRYKTSADRVPETWRVA